MIIESSDELCGEFFEESERNSGLKSVSLTRRQTDRQTEALLRDDMTLDNLDNYFSSDYYV